MFQWGTCAGCVVCSNGCHRNIWVPVVLRLVYFPCLVIKLALRASIWPKKSTTTTTWTSMVNWTQCSESILMLRWASSTWHRSIALSLCLFACDKDCYGTGTMEQVQWNRCNVCSTRTGNMAHCIYSPPPLMTTNEINKQALSHNGIPGNSIMPTARVPHKWASQLMYKSIKCTVQSI